MLLPAPSGARPLQFKSFAQKKVQFSQAAVTASAPMLVLVDNECLRSQLPAKNGAGLLPHLATFHAVTLPMRVQAHSVSFNSALNTAELEGAAQASPCVIGVAENPRVQTAAFERDPLAVNQIHLPAINQAAGEGYFFHPIFGVRQPVVAAVVDSGVQADHPDLRDRMWHGANGETGIDIVRADSDPGDDFGHGTHVAGLLGAQRDNSVGVRGVMGDWVKLMAVKTQGSDGSGTVADVVNGILWAADHGAEVMNLSLTSTGTNPALADALDYALAKNTVIAVAAGNDGAEVSNSNFVAPAAYAPNRRGLISTGSIDAITYLKSNFSNFSSSFIEIAAPGAAGRDGLLSTFMGSTYQKIAGTSMASPQVAGAAALAIGFCKTHGVTYTSAQIEDFIEDSAVQSAALEKYFNQGRRLDLDRLGRLLFNSEVLDATGGFDDP